MNDTPYQRDYLQILGVLTTVGALIFGLVFAGASAKRGVTPTDARWLAVFAVLAALIAGGAGLARARIWGGALLATAYAAAAVWYGRLAFQGVHVMSAGRLAALYVAVALLLVPAVLVIRWRRFLGGT